jgi:Ran GTPase-activating protein (RanGAP) involved in mRNA processing and transport
VDDTIRSLDFQYTSIYGGGCLVLEKVLQSNSTIHTVNLPYNGIDDIGMKALVRGLEKNRTVRNINLRGNKIMNSGGRSLSRCLLGRNHTLCNIDLSNNALLLSVVHELKATVSQRNSASQSGTTLSIRLDGVHMFAGRRLTHYVCIVEE